MRVGHRSLAIGVAWLLLSTIAACAPSVRAFRAPGPGLSGGATLAFVPLTNLTEVENAGRIFTDKLMIETGRLELFHLQDPGVVMGALRRLRILTPDRIAADQMRGLAEAVGTNYLLTGTVTQCAEGGTYPGQYPSAAVSLRLVDASDGRVLWAATLARAGNDSETVFGLGRVRSLDELSRRMAKELVHSMRGLTRPGRPLRTPPKEKTTP